MVSIKSNYIYTGDTLKTLKLFSDNSVDCCITSPPYYGLRDYGIEGQIGLEDTLHEYIDNILLVFDEIKRVLKKEGTFWLVIGDSYAGSNQGSGNKVGLSGLQSTNFGSEFVIRNGITSKLSKVEGCKSKDMCGIPWTIALKLRKRGWYLRQDIIWAKPNPMPESVRDRCTRSHEYIFLLSKSRKYYFDSDAIKEKASTDSALRYKSNMGLKNKRDVWVIASKGYKGAHFATFPPELIKPCILAGCPKNGTVLDPFFGSGTVGVVAKTYGRNYIGIDINPSYCKIAEERINSIKVK